MFATVSATVLAAGQVLLQVLAQADTSVPDDVGYVYGAYGLVVVVLVGYAAFTIRRGRAVGRRLPPEDRRWM